MIQQYFLLQVAIATFSAYTLSSSENILTAKKAFVTLAYFNVINFPLTIAAMALSNLMQVNWQENMAGNRHYRIVYSLLLSMI